MEAKKIKITLPDVKVDEKQKEAIIKKTLTEDLEKRDGLLAKCLIFIWLNDVVSVTELCKYLRNYYQIDFERVNIFRAVQKLVNLNLVYKVSSGYVITLSKSERKEIHERILQKHHQFLQNLPIQFRQRYNDVNYMWLTNGDGTKYLEWACRLLNFKYEEK